MWRHVFNVPESCVSKTGHAPKMVTHRHVKNVPPQLTTRQVISRLALNLPSGTGVPQVLAGGKDRRDAGPTGQQLTGRKKTADAMLLPTMFDS